jgi:hypothetical protein
MPGPPPPAQVVAAAAVCERAAARPLDGGAPRARAGHSPALPVGASSLSGPPLRPGDSGASGEARRWEARPAAVPASPAGPQGGASLVPVRCITASTADAAGPGQRSRQNGETAPMFRQGSACPALPSTLTAQAPGCSERFHSTTKRLLRGVRQCGDAVSCCCESRK